MQRSEVNRWPGGRRERKPFMRIIQLAGQPATAVGRFHESARPQPPPLYLLAAIRCRRCLDRRANRAVPAMAARFRGPVQGSQVLRARRRHHPAGLRIPLLRHQRRERRGPRRRALLHPRSGPARRHRRPHPANGCVAAPHLAALDACADLDDRLRRGPGASRRPRRGTDLPAGGIAGRRHGKACGTIRRTRRGLQGIPRKLPGRTGLSHAGRLYPDPEFSDDASPTSIMRASRISCAVRCPARPARICG
jgi:hypothetical protein